MIKQASKKDIIWGYAAQFLNIGSGIIIIPVAIKYLSSEDMGFWYLFIALSSLAQLLEFGFQPTISRMVSYVYSGASELKAEGLSKNSNIINYQLLYDLIESSKIIYHRISFVIAIVLLFFGSIYLSTFDSFDEERLVAWLVFAVATVVNFYFTYLNALIIGKGKQSVLYRIITASKLLMLLVSMPLLFYGLGLMAMALGTLVSLVTTRYLLYLYLSDKINEDTKVLSEIKSINESQVSTVWQSAWKLGITSLGAFLVLRANQFIVSSFLGLKIAASYGLTIQILSVLSSVSLMYFNLNLPKIASLQSYKDKAAIGSILKKSYFMVNVLYTLGGCCLVVVGLQALEYLDVNTNLVQLELLLFMLLMYGLELNHNISATFLTTFNKIPFLYASVISGLLIVSTSILIVKYTAYGVWGIVFSQFIIQLSYNNWYWPLQVWRYFKGVGKI